MAWFKCLIRAVMIIIGIWARIGFYIFVYPFRYLFLKAYNCYYAENKNIEDVIAYMVLYYLYMLFLLSLPVLTGFLIKEIGYWIMSGFFMGVISLSVIPVSAVRILDQLTYSRYDYIDIRWEWVKNNDPSYGWKELT